MSEVNTTKLALAERQLETAIGLFVSRTDRVSAITLAGAADGILHGLVLKSGKQPFSDYAIGVAEVINKQTPAKSKYGKHINNTLDINRLKHMDPEEDLSLNLDADMSALGAILKAISNHKTLVPEHPDYIKAMLHWTWMFFDGEKITEHEPYDGPAGERMAKEYQERPEEVKKMEARFAKKYKAPFTNEKP
jgi:hypothetical protein